jgi:hypothetical protein
MCFVQEAVFVITLNFCTSFHFWVATHLAPFIFACAAGDNRYNRRTHPRSVVRQQATATCIRSSFAKLIAVAAKWKGARHFYSTIYVVLKQRRLWSDNDGHDFRRLNIRYRADEIKTISKNRKITPSSGAHFCCIGPTCSIRGVMDLNLLQTLNILSDVVYVRLVVDLSPIARLVSCVYIWWLN